MKVAHLSSAHPAYDVRIHYKECKTLAEAGYDVVIILPFEGKDDTPGLRIHPLPLPRGRRDRMTKTVWQVYRAALAENADVYHFHDPELLPIGLLLKMHGKRVIYDVHEDYVATTGTKEWLPKFARGALSGAVKLVQNVGVACFDKTMAATPSIASKLNPRKTVLLQNFPFTSELVASTSDDYASRPNQLLYAGIITSIRCAREMVDAMNLLPPSVDAKLLMVGAVDGGLEEVVAAIEASSRVTYGGVLKRDGLQKAMAQSRAGIVVFYPLPNHVDAQPNKLFEYMSAGLPVIASDFPLWREIVDGAKCGLLVDPLDPKSIASAVQWVFEHPAEAEQMGLRGQAAVRERFNWDSEARTLVNTYAAIAGK